MIVPVHRRALLRRLCVIAAVLLPALLTATSVRAAAGPKLPADCVSKGSYYVCGTPGHNLNHHALPGPNVPQREAASGRVTKSPGGGGGPLGATSNTVITGSNYCQYLNDTRYTEWNYASSNDNATAGPLLGSFDAKASAYSQGVLGADYEWAYAIDGHRFIPQDSSGALGSAITGEIDIPWHVGGIMNYNVDSLGPFSGQASGYETTEIGVLDETTGAVYGRQAVSLDSQSNDTGGSYQADISENGYWSISFTYVFGHTYRPYVKTAVSTTSTPYNTVIEGIPVFLSADQNVDFYDDYTDSIYGNVAGGGWMGSVKYQFNLPPGYTVNCGS